MSGAQDHAAWRVPGRIEFLGKHTDYAGGQVLVGAVDRGITVRAETTNQPGVLEASSSESPDSVLLRAGEACTLPPGHWGRYLHTVLERLSQNFGPSRGVRLEVSSDLPPASGMSSSSALICASALAIADINGWSSSELWQRNMPNRLSLAGYLAGVEAGRPWRELAGAEGVGTQGGSEDHTGMLCGEEGTLLRAGFAPLEIRERVNWPDEWAIVVGVSGVLAEKTGAALADYNRGPYTLRDFLARWNAHTGRDEASLASAVDALLGGVQAGRACIADGPGRETVARTRQVGQAGETSPDPLTGSESSPSLMGAALPESATESLKLAELLETVPELADFLALTQPGYERRRVEQFLEESLLLVPEGAKAVATGDAGRVAEVVRRSHAAAEAKLLNQVPATSAMVNLAVGMGAIAASGFGAGWGGSVYAVVPSTDAQDFAAQWLAEYRRRGRGDYLSDAEALRASTIVTRPGAGAQPS